MTGLTSSSPLARALGSVVASILCLVSVSTTEVHAQFLVINDCNGFTRAFEQVGNDARNIQFDVSGVQGGDVSGARVSLTNNVTGDIRYAAAKSGRVAFSNVLPGAYTVATEATGLIVGAISFSPVPLLGIAGSTLVGGTVVGGGIVGAILGVDAIIEATDGDPGAPPAPTPTPEPTPDDDCAVCDPDASPPPLDESDFADGVSQGATLSPSR